MAAREFDFSSFAAGFPMNAYQKSGILLVRLCAIAMVVVAVMGFVHFAYTSVWGTTDATAHARAEAVLWLITGAVLFAASVPLGRWLGRDLG